MTDRVKKSHSIHKTAAADEASLSRWIAYTNSADTVRRMPVAGGFSGSSHAHSHQ